MTKTHLISNATIYTYPLTEQISVCHYILREVYTTLIIQMIHPVVNVCFLPNI